MQKEILKNKTLKKSRSSNVNLASDLQCKELSFHALFIYWMGNSLSGKFEVRATQILTFYFRFSLHLHKKKTTPQMSVVRPALYCCLMSPTVFDVASMLVGFTVLTNFTDCHKPIL